MANRVQIVITVDAAQAGAAIGKVESALTGMGATAVSTTDKATRGFQKFESQGLLKAVLGANLLERALNRVGQALKGATLDSTLLTARADVLDTVLVQVAKNTNNSAAAFQSADKEIQALGVDAIRSKEAVLKFATAELSVADAVAIANVARNRAQVSGETTSETMERLTRSILAQEVELLKLAGIVVRQDDAFKRYAKQIGKTASELNELERRQAFINEILRQTRNDVGLYEKAWEQVGKRLLSLPRLARQAGIALGRGFQTELALGVDGAIAFLGVVERNGEAVVVTAKAVALLTGAYIALRIAQSEMILVNVGAFLSSLLPKLTAVRGGMATMTLLMMGAGGTVGLIGAYGLLLAAGLALGLALSEITTHFRNQAEMAKVAQFDIEGWRKSLADAGIEVRSNEAALLLLNRVTDVNIKLREKGLEPLRLNKDLEVQLRAAEDSLRFATDEGTAALERRAKALEALQKQLERREFKLSLEGLGEVEQERAKASRDLEEIFAQARGFPDEMARAVAIAEAMVLKTQSDLAKKLSAARDEAARVLLEAIDRQLEGIEKVEDERAADLEKFRAIVKEYEGLRELGARAEVAVVRAAEEEITRIRREQFQEQERLARQAAEPRMEVIRQIAALERETALAGLDTFQRIEFEKLETLKRVEEELADKRFQGLITVNDEIELSEHARVATTERANAQILDENQRLADEQLRLQERNLREYDRFLDRMVRFTEQSGNILTNIWRTISDEFQRSVTKMVLSWLFGLRQINAGRSSGGAGGTILGGLFGGIFGPSVPVSARTPDYNPNASSFINSVVGGASVPGVGVGAGAAGNIPLAVPTAAASDPLGGIGQLLAKVPGGGGGGVLLGALLGLQVGSKGRPFAGLLAGLGGTIGGVALSGASAGVAGGVGALAGAKVALAGFLTNPIGLAILGGIGLTSFIVGVLSRGKKKRKATDIANEGFADINQIVRAFELRQVDFLRAVDGMNQIWDQMVQGWEQIGGKVGRRSISSQQPFFAAYVARVEEIQRKRNERSDLIASLPLPEFQSGGLVHGVGNRPLLAALHPGEFVLNRKAVDRIGTPKLEQANAGESPGGITVIIQTPDKSGVEEMLRSNQATFGRFIKSVVRRDVRDGGGLLAA